MTRTGTYKYYGQSLLWIASYFAVSVSVSNIAQLVVVDFIHENPYRTQANAVWMMAFFTPLFGSIAFVGALLVFTLPQYFQALIERRLKRMEMRYVRSVIITILPITTVVTWYCWEYLTPTDFNLGINDGPEWRPYQHGLTWLRYIKTLGFQAPVTLFCLLYCDAHVLKSLKRQIIVMTFMLAIIAGIVY